jgi:hypothetical protein
MTTLTTSLKKGGIVLLDPTNGSLQRVIVFQYNPDTLTRTLKIEEVEDSKNGRARALKLKGPPVETFKIDVEIDATANPDFLDRSSEVAQVGIFPDLYALETIVYPKADSLQETRSKANSGKIEIAPTDAPITLFVWSANRIMPVRLTDVNVTEEAFDPDLNPIRAKVSLGMKVLSISDVGFDHRVGSLYMTYHRNKERLAAQSRSGTLGELGITRIP